ncbi:unnamed protein product [Euphydryas editha]|uniref:Uncharacterized protein n=1 Tax=Euphydryas editha TaxID=104508 RepID=A0AAU9U2X4_EUPED|nr:unnamed protein product [Euphydryas editha]
MIIFAKSRSSLLRCFSVISRLQAPGEALTTQHTILVGCIKLPKPMKDHKIKVYALQLLHEEFPSKTLESTPAIHGLIIEISGYEVEKAVKTMKNHKAVGPNNIPADRWKMLGPAAINGLTKLFNAILFNSKIPESWRISFILPFFKNKVEVTVDIISSSHLTR